jgi:hypothetical protein
VSKQSGLLERLKKIIIISAEIGEVGCPSEHGLVEPKWPGKVCIADDCFKCWELALKEEEDFMYPRPLTEQEKTWLIKGLQDEFKDDPSFNIDFYMKQLDGLKVYYKCDCGDPNCYTIGFIPPSEKHLDYCFVDQATDDGRSLLIHETEDRRISMLEII